MKLTLKVVSIFAKGPKADTKFSLPALGWTERDGVIQCRWPFHRVFLARARKAHEAEHNLLDLGNEMHHPAGELCGRVGHALRLKGTLHLSDRALRAADSLKRDGDSVDV